MSLYDSFKFYVYACVCGSVCACVVHKKREMDTNIMIISRLTYCNCFSFYCLYFLFSMFSAVKCTISKPDTTYKLY